MSHLWLQLLSCMTFIVIKPVLVHSLLFGTGTSTRSSSYVYKSYQTSIYCTPQSKILVPKDEIELQEIVNMAISKNSTVKAFGSLHSLTDVICTDGYPISLRNFDSAILNDDKTATFGAGLELHEALEFLQKNNRSLILVPAFGGITIGGALGTGAHGSSLLHPTSLSDQLVKLTILDGTGNIKIIDQPDDVNAFRVHLGLLGLIINVTLQTVPLFKMTVENKLEPDSILLDGTAMQWAHEYDWFQMWWFPKSKSVVVSKGNYTYDLNTPGNAYTNFIPNETPLEIAAASKGFELMQKVRNNIAMYTMEEFTKLSLHQEVVGKPPIYTEDGKTIANPATGYGWKLQTNKCTDKCAWDNGDLSILPEESSMAFELSELPNVIKMMSKALTELPAAFFMVGVLIRFCKPSPALMSISTGRPTATVEWATPMRANPYSTSKAFLGTFQAIMQAMVQEHGGRAHWGKNGLYYHSQPVLLSSSVPNRNSFINAMHKFDPNGIFLNKFGQRLLGKSNKMDIDPQVNHLALQDYALCNTSTDCGYLQVCKKFREKYPICRDILIKNLIVPSSIQNFTSRISIFETFLDDFLPPLLSV